MVSAATGSSSFSSAAAGAAPAALFCGRFWIRGARSTFSSPLLSRSSPAASAGVSPAAWASGGLATLSSLDDAAAPPAAAALRWAGALFSSPLLSSSAAPPAAVPPLRRARAGASSSLLSGSVGLEALEPPRALLWPPRPPRPSPACTLPPRIARVGPVGPVLGRFGPAAPRGLAALWSCPSGSRSSPAAWATGGLATSSSLGDAAAAPPAASSAARHRPGCRGCSSSGSAKTSSSSRFHARRQRCSHSWRTTSTAAFSGRRALRTALSLRAASVASPYAQTRCVVRASRLAWCVAPATSIMARACSRISPRRPVRQMTSPCISGMPSPLGSGLKSGDKPGEIQSGC